MKLLKNRFVIGTLCIIAGLLFSFVALPALQGGGQGAYTSAVRMKESVQAGTQITADMVEMVNVPEKLVASGISDTSSVVGRYANTGLYAGDYLTIAKLSATLAEQNSFSAGMQKGKTVVSVILPSLASGVSGRLLPGDIVTVMALPKSSVNQSLGVEPESTGDSTSGATIYPELQYIEVCMVTTSDGADAKVNANPGEDEKNSLPVTVSFYADQEQALRLAELEQQGIIHLVFVARGEAAAQYIPDEQRVLNMEVN